MQPVGTVGTRRNTMLKVALIAGIDKISIAISDNLGQRFLWGS
jgi:hypothetical protein